MTQSLESNNLPPSKRKPYRGIAMEGRIARWYSRNMEKSLEQYRAWARIVSENAATRSAILEVAPGPGYLSIELAKLGHYKIVGLDISKTFVDIAQKKAREAEVDVEFRQGNAGHMPFPDRTFDFIICTSAFKNFAEPVRVLDEMFRVLRQGGTALIIDLRKDAPKAEINEYVKQMNLNTINTFMTKLTFKGLLKRAYTRTEFQDLAAESMFGTSEIRDGGIGFEVWLRKGTPLAEPKQTSYLNA